MKKKVTVEIEKEKLFCDSCGAELCFIEENHNSRNLIDLSFKGTGYSAYGGAVDSEWDYQLCRECACALKDYLDAGRNLQELPKADK